MENFNHIYQQYYPTIFRLVYGFVGKEEIAADLTQEVFIKLFTHLQAGAKLDFPKTWLYKVAANECLNYLTRNKTIYPLDEAISIECNKSDDTENQIIKNETQQLLQMAMQAQFTPTAEQIGIYESLHEVDANTAFQQK